MPSKRITKPRKPAKPKIDERAYKVVQWFTNAEVDRANPETRKQLKVCHNLLKEYTPLQIKLAVRLKQQLKGINNLNEVLWDSPKGPMYITLASEPPTSLPAWITFLDKVKSLGEVLDFEVPSLVSEHLSKMKTLNETKKSPDSIVTKTNFRRPKYSDWESS